MDFETAQLQADYLNEILEEYSDTIFYKIFALWNTQYEKQFQTVLIPKKYIDDFNNGSESIQLAFARVSIKALVLPFTTADELVSNFDSEAEKDSELSNYLKG
jgi:hypothetical protein